jgi:hypothetical protein
LLIAHVVITTRINGRKRKRRDRIMFFLGCIEKYCSMLGLTARALLAHSRMLVRTRLEEKKLLSYRVVVSQIVYRVELGCS